MVAANALAFAYSRAQTPLAVPSSGAPEIALQVTAVPLRPPHRWLLGRGSLGAAGISGAQEPSRPGRGQPTALAGAAAVVGRNRRH